MASNRELRPFQFESFSLWFVKQVLERRPDWYANLCRTEHEQEGLPVYCAEFTWPSQNPNVEEPLRLTLDTDRIAALWWLRIGKNHIWNYDWISFMPPLPLPVGWSEDRREGVDNIVTFVEKFLAEEVAAIWTSDADLGTYGAVRSVDVQSNTFRRGKVSTNIRSWRGSLDASFGPRAG